MILTAMTMLDGLGGTFVVIDVIDVIDVIAGLIWRSRRNAPGRSSVQSLAKRHCRAPPVTAQVRRSDADVSRDGCLTWCTTYSGERRDGPVRKVTTMRGVPARSGWLRAGGWLRSGVNGLLPAGVIAAVPTFAACLLAGAQLRAVVSHASGMVLLSLMVVVFRHIARLPGLPRAAARFWAGIARAMFCFSLGIAVDLVITLSHDVFGTPNEKLGVELIYPVAALLTIVAMYQYPTTARTRWERVSVGMDAAIVLLGSAIFIWYFSVSHSWTPDAGWHGLFAALVVPLLTLVAGFAVLKIAFVGAGVISRTTLVCFGVAIAITAVGSSLPLDGTALTAQSTAAAMLAQLVAVAGGVAQYHTSVHGRQPALRPGRRRAFSVLPFGAATAAFVLLVLVLAPTLAWRGWGVLGGIGVLQVVVSARQFLALRENGRLLANNHKLTGQLRQQAWFDQLTGLANRVQYGDRIGQTLERCRRHGTRAALLLIDLDDFKVVNDAFGHSAGDAVLREVSQRLLSQVRVTDLVCRVGGDEFVVIAEDVDEIAAIELAERIIQAVAEPVRIGQHTAAVGASIGINLIDDTGTDPGEILHNADLAMYAGKAAGKGAWRLTNQAAPPPVISKITANSTA